MGNFFHNLNVLHSAKFSTCPPNTVCPPKMENLNTIDGNIVGQEHQQSRITQHTC